MRRRELTFKLHFFHHLEAPLARALLKLPSLEALVDFMLLTLSYSSFL
jgi:hypothetical protein